MKIIDTILYALVIFALALVSVYLIKVFLSIVVALLSWLILLF